MSNLLIMQFLKFDDSSWSLSIVKDNNDVVLSLHWADKLNPTHQIRLAQKDFIEIIKTAKISIDFKN